MFRRRFLAVALLSAFVLSLGVPASWASDAPAGAAPAGAGSYGARLSDAPVVKVSTLLSTPEDYVGKTVKVEGRIVGVCEMRGCWIEIAGDKEFESIRLKVDDGDIVFPVEAKGHNTIAEGVFEKIELSLEQTQQMKKHECEKKGEKFDPASCTQPGVLYRLGGLGAVVE